MEFFGVRWSVAIFILFCPMFFQCWVSDEGTSLPGSSIVLVVLYTCVDEVDGLVSHTARGSLLVMFFSILFGRMNTVFNGWHLDCCF